MTAKCALLSICYNEPDFFKMWYAYYSKFFNAEDIYVLDDGSDEGQYSGYDCNIQITHPRNAPGQPRHISGSGDEHIRMVNTEKCNELLKTYEYVLRIDMDEFVVPDPIEYPGGLGQFIAEFDDDFAQCSGYNVIDNGVTFNPDQTPWLAQRTHYQRDWIWYCKVVLVNQSPNWSQGFHQSRWNCQVGPREGGTGAKYPHERENLKLFHFHYICKDLTYRRWAARNTTDQRWSANNIFDKTLFERTLLNHDQNHPSLIREEIPERWKMVL